MSVCVSVGVSVCGFVCVSVLVRVSYLHGGTRRLAVGRRIPGFAYVGMQQQQQQQ